MKILFLDIDGVLNTESPGLEVPLLENLKTVIERTGAEIVISSDWRKFFGIATLKEKFAKAVPYDWPIVDYTTEMLFRPRRPFAQDPLDRQDQIDFFLQENTVTTYAIVDDFWTFPKHKDRFVQTKFYAGLTKEDADALIQILGERDEQAKSDPS